MEGICNRKRRDAAGGWLELWPASTEVLVSPVHKEIAGIQKLVSYLSEAGSTMLAATLG